MDMTARIAQLEAALRPFAHHAMPGDDARSTREKPIRVTEGQLARAWFVLHDRDWGGSMAKRLRLDHEALEAVEQMSDGPVHINVLGPSADDPGVWRAELPPDVGKAMQEVCDVRDGGVAR